MQQEIRKGDFVEVVVGRDKGKLGEVIRVFPDERRILVRNVNLVMRQTRPTRKHPRGEMITTEDPLHMANVRLVPRQVMPQHPFSESRF
jgi:large subunit ribosomal protein L24